MSSDGTAWRWRLIRITGASATGGAVVVREEMLRVSCVADVFAQIGALPGDSEYTHMLAEPFGVEMSAAVLQEMTARAGARPEAMVVGCEGEADGRAAGLERLFVRLETGFRLADPVGGCWMFPLEPVRRLVGRGRKVTCASEIFAHLAWGDVPVEMVEAGPCGRMPLPAGAGACGWWRHTRLLLRRLVPWPHPRLADQPAEKPLDLRHPIRLLKSTLTEYATPYELGVSAFVGVFLGALPLLGVHTVVILYVTTRFRLNRAMAVVTQNLCAPPVVPVVCVEIGYYLRRGEWLMDASRQTLLLEFHQRMFEWFIGSLLIGPALGLVTGLGVALGARLMLARKRRKEEPLRINARRRGNRLGFLSFIWALRLFGRRGAYGLLSMVILYYVLFDRTARRLAAPYLRRRFPEQKGWRRVVGYYRLFHSQGVSLIDRYRMMFTPERFKNVVTNYERVQALVEDRSRGFVLLVSHTGNWQAMMLALKRMDRNVTLLMRPEENPVTQQYLQVQGTSAFRFVSPDTPMGGVIELTRQFGEGDVVAIMGDRAYDAATLPVEFMGDTAQFPCGAFQLAAAWGCPVVVFFTAKTGVDEYTVDMAGVLRVGTGGDRRSNLREAMQAYARCLESFAQKYPYQVYLFDDVWRAPDTGGKPKARSPN